MMSYMRMDNQYLGKEYNMGRIMVCAVILPFCRLICAHIFEICRYYYKKDVQQWEELL